MNSTNMVRAAVALALLGTAPAVFAQTAVTQNVQNLAPVNNIAPTTGPTIDASAIGLDLGTGASASVSATGAVGSVSVSAINSSIPAPTGGLGTIQQGTSTTPISNTGAVSNSGSIDVGSLALAGSTGGALGLGASVAVSSTGAVGSVSVSIVNDNSQGGPAAAYAGQVFAPSSDVSQVIVNGANVANTGSVSGATTLYTGASESVSATGAVASVSESVLYGATASASPPTTFPVGTSSVTLNAPTEVGQNVTNTAAVNNTGTISNSTSGPIAPAGTNFDTFNAGGLGQGASASVGSTGAVASVSLSATADLTLYSPTSIQVNLPALGPVGQTVLNSGEVNNTGSVTVGNLAGNGASVSVSATGAVGSVSISGNNVVLSGGSVASVSQNVSEAGVSVNNSANIDTGSVAGAGASVSAGATGAVASVSYSNIGGSLGTAPLSIGNVSQTSENSAEVSNQTGFSGTGPVLITVADPAGSSGSAPVVSGAGASVSGSATGAVASVSSNTVAPNGTTGGGLVYTGGISQTATNGAAVGNNVVIAASGAVVSGDGASVSIGATGAVSSVSTSSVDSAAPSADYSAGNVVQVSTNGQTAVAAPITNVGSILNVGSLSGIGSSASVSATGSVASFSASSVGDTSIASVVGPPTISQTVMNYSQINNTGNISFGGATAPATLGVGASASVAATGAVASASFRAVH